MHKYLTRLRSATSPTPSVSLVLQCVKLGDVLKICNGIIFESYPGLPHIGFCNASSDLLKDSRCLVHYRRPCDQSYICIATCTSTI